jgi:hypothetical protein
MLDEIEVLSKNIDKGRYDEEDILNLLRHLIQHHSCISVLLTSSILPEDYKEWSGYLINCQMIKISYLQRDEAVQLIREPVKNFELDYEIEAEEEVLKLTRCHPAFIHLLCEEIVWLKNQQKCRLVNLQDVIEVVPRALETGSEYFLYIETFQVDAIGKNVLHFLAAQGQDAVIDREVLAHRLEYPIALNETLNLLIKRDLIEAVNGGYCFQVEMVRRWFAQKSL